VPISNLLIHASFSHVCTDKSISVALCRYLLTNTDVLQHHRRMNNSHQSILDLATQNGLIRPSDLSKRGLPTVALNRMVRKGILQRVGRGLYAFPKALFLHKAPWPRWQSNIHKPSSACYRYCDFMNSPRRHRSRFGWQSETKRALQKLILPHYALCASPAPHLLMVSKNTSLMVPVRVTTIARTVADCFKFRNKIGLDVALEALQEAWNTKRTSMDELWRYATVCRVTNVMRPYMESLT
jgi:hypothetical protein